MLLLAKSEISSSSKVLLRLQYSVRRGMSLFNLTCGTSGSVRIAIIVKLQAILGCSSLHNEIAQLHGFQEVEVVGTKAMLLHILVGLSLKKNIY